jgi:protein-disulfide isomerase
MSTQNRELNRAARAAAVRADHERQERNRRIFLIVGILVILGAVVAGGAWYSSGGSATPAAVAKVDATAGSGAVIAGPASAPTKVTIYEDFQCPYCRQLEDETRDFLRENAAAGKVQVEYHPINLLSQDVYSARAMNAFAAVLAHSTPQAALELHDLLYANQPYETASASVTPAQIAGFVKAAGGDNAAVETAMRSTDAAFFAAANQVLQSKNITGTPTVYVNGTQVIGSVDQIVSAIETAVG